MLWTLPIAFAVTPAPAPAPAPPAPLIRTLDADEGDRSIAEGVEILRRLLVRSIQGSGASSVALPHPVQGTQNGWQYQLGLGEFPTFTGWQPRGGAAASNARGFHLPAVGATFTIDVTVPVELVTVSAKQNEEAQEDEGKDEWDTMRDAVRQGEAAESTVDATAEFWAMTDPSALVDAWPQNAVMTLDAKAVEAALDSVLESLARHGHRLDLAADESITIALTIEGRDPAQASLAVPTEGGEYDQAVWFAYAQALTSGQTAGDLTRRVVLQVPVSALGKGAGDAASLRGRTRIHRY
ncbi:MAG: hypothetical protein AAF957_17400 [Planctomycetota bacterium]